MRRGLILVALGLIALSVCWVDQPEPALVQQGPAVQWIWFNEGDPARSAPAGTRYFRRVFNINRPVEIPVDEATLDITADDAFTVWVNGHKVGQGDTWKRVYRFDVKKHLIHGNNVVAVEAKNIEGAAGLLVRLGYVPNGMSRLAMVSDGAWKASKTAGEGWQKVDHAATGWSPVKALGPIGSTGPWKGLVWDAGGDDRFSVPPGFRVEQAVKLPADDPKFSLVNMCFDDKGRLLVSREGGPVMVCTDPDKAGVLQTVRPYCTQVKNCQGMCWVKDALLLVGNGPQGTGLYRVRDTKGLDQTDEVTLLHQFEGGMGEHGPHAILHGPDDWLYVVIGNHAWAKIGPEAAKNGANPEKLAANSPLTRWPTGRMGPDQGNPKTTEDVLLPRLNDGRGHAADILAPGGTIWRLDHNGKNMSLVAAGFRNHFDAAFSPQGELFTFDSDMEWDENLPWYRAVRVCHCPPGADFVWRTGAANTPDYYIDSLPPTAETGRGSPVGLEFYDHHVFPEKYRGAYFMADWSLGVIWVAHLERAGASYKAKIERFCSGAPMNVTDLAVGPDGAMYFCMGGRDTQGGVYRIVGEAKGALQQEGAFPPTDEAASEWLIRQCPQPLAAWSRTRFKALLDRAGARKAGIVSALAARAIEKGDLRALRLLEIHKRRPAGQDLFTLFGSKDPLVRAEVIRMQATWLSGTRTFSLLFAQGLKDPDPLVRRRACEAIIRATVELWGDNGSEAEPNVDHIWKLLGDRDRFVRHAARLVLERIPAKKWVDRIGKEANDLTAWNAIIALCQTNNAVPYAETVFGRLRGVPGPKVKDAQAVLDYLRTLQMVMVHTQQRPIWVKAIAEQCNKLFPHRDWRVNRELAILLVALQREGHLSQPVQGKIMAALKASKDDRMQQIHYAYCLRLLKDGWAPQDKADLTAWYDGTQSWRGGHSFTPFLENIFRDALAGYTAADRQEILQHAEERPLAALVLAQRLQIDPHVELLPDLNKLSARLAQKLPAHRGQELRQAVEEAVLSTKVRQVTADNFPFLVQSLGSGNPRIRGEALAALRKLEIKPKAEDPAPYRAVLQMVTSVKGGAPRWEAVQLLRQWSGRGFGGSKATADKELKSWALWFTQTFPKEPPLPNAVAGKETPSKYRYGELLTYLTKNDGRVGDAVKGRLVFEKAQCFKCHKYGKEGEGVGPDLTTLSKRFKRADTLESIIYPSKVISDQYRSTTITTTNGQQVTGLVAVQGDTVTVLQSDASKITLKRDEIDTQVASLISVMPERLLDTLSLREIADLFAFLESEPK
jgi:putative heme-binding domain-containing protein